MISIDSLPANYCRRSASPHLQNFRACLSSPLAKYISRRAPTLLQEGVEIKTAWKYRKDGEWFKHDFWQRNRMKEKTSSWLACRLTLFDQGCCKRRQCHLTHWTQLTLQEPTGCIFPRNSFERESLSSPIRFIQSAAILRRVTAAWFGTLMSKRMILMSRFVLKRGKLPHFYNTVSERPFKTKSSFKRKYTQLLYAFSYFGTWFGQE